MELGANNYVLETWINTTTASQYATIISRMPYSFGVGCFSLLMNYASSTAGDVVWHSYEASGGGAVTLQTTGVSIRDGAWHHIAVVRSGTTHSLYVDGTRRANATWSSYTVADVSGNVYIGRDQTYGRYLAGNLDDVRITIGGDRGYTGASITIPSAEMTA